MPSSDPPQQDQNADSLQQDQTKLRYYKQLGLAPGATMHDIEAAYWRVARELKGQAAMVPYNDAYEALVKRAPIPTETPEPTEPTPAPAAMKKEKRAVRPPSKLGWPA